MMPGSRRIAPAAAVLAAAMGAALAALVSMLASCATVQEDVRYEAPEGAAGAELATLEAELVVLRADPDPDALRAIRSALDDLAETPSTDPLYRSRALALGAEAALLGGDEAGAGRRVEEALEAYPGDEVAAVTASRMAETPEERLAVIEEALSRADGSKRLLAELGSVFTALGRYREAVAAFDAALPFLPPEYGALYGADRERAYALRDADTAPAAADAYLTAGSLPLLGMAAMTQSETALLDDITGGVDWAPAVLYDRLSAAGWYVPGSPPDRAVTRKDAALFLWHALAHGRSEFLERYSRRYADRGTSPVPDVAYGSPWFDAALGWWRKAS